MLNEVKMKDTKKIIEELKKENMDLLIERAKLKKQIERLMKVIKFLTEGE
jgi:hypothetical protein